MAQKDWKKTSTNINYGTPEWVKKSGYVFIGVWKKSENKYSVELNDNNKIELLKSFKNYEKALKFAKLYMRTH